MTDKTTGAAVVDRLRVRLTKLSASAGLIAAGVGGVVLSGWIFGIDPIERLLPRATWMNANAAAGFLLAGLSLWLHHLAHGGRWAPRLGSALAAGVLAVGLLKSGELLFGWGLGEAQEVVRQWPVPIRVGLRGYTSSAIALVFVLLGLSLAMLHLGRRSTVRVQQWLAVAAGGAALLPLLGYAYGVDELHHPSPSYAWMPVHAAATFLILALGLLLARPGAGLVNRITEPTFSGVSLRYLLPAAVVVPLIIGWLRGLGEELDLYEPRFGRAVYTLATIGVLMALIWRYSGWMRRAEQRLRDLNETLEQRVAERSAVAEARARRLQAMAAELTQAEERERRRLAAVLHDDLQQSIVGAKMYLTAYRRPTSGVADPVCLDQVSRMLDEAVATSRSLTSDLSPSILYEAGLGAALRWLARKQQQKYGLKVHTSVDESLTLPESASVLLFQSVRELLFNTVKHARAVEAWVEMKEEGGGVCIEVRDRGAGFDVDRMKATDQKESFGLLSVRERLESIGGSAQIVSRPGEGTRVTLRLPLPRAAGALASGRAGAVPAAGPLPAGGGAHARDGVLRVMLVDDQNIVRGGLLSLLDGQPDIQIVAEASDGSEVLDVAARSSPDVVVMDVSMPYVNGVDATRELVERMPHVRVIGLSMHDQQDMGAAMIHAGAEAYVCKTGPVDDLLRAIRGVRPGKEAA